ncbi:hypothetical protein MTR_2g451020 [Medicago truncatula]|uniref:Uncharacterized protein n=1 Tax=Medicago truncatula TaxID=3880 RepID=A0A072V7Y3_MEDTR|nr:hypothetical protein MTR_2g451020 [Medicago truncatula]
MQRQQHQLEQCNDNINLTMQYPCEHQALNFNDSAWTQQQMQQQPTTSTTSTTTYNFNDIDDNSGNNNNNSFAS